MNWEAIATIAAVVSAIAVVVSLVYLAVQLRMNTMALRANGAWDSETIYGNANLDIARDPNIALLLSRAFSAGAKADDFDESETAQLYFAVRCALQFAQAQWWLWKSGNLPGDLWDMRRRWARNFIEAPAINAIWQADLEQHIFFEQFVEDIQAELPQGELSMSPQYR